MWNGQVNQLDFVIFLVVRVRIYCVSWKEGFGIYWDTKKQMDIRQNVLVIICGGSPAPGMNGVISSVTIEALNNGFQVIGLYDGRCISIFSHSLRL